MSDQQTTAIKDCSDRAVMQRLCALDDCDGAHYARGWCHKHYRRFMRYGDPTFTPQPRIEHHEMDAEGRTFSADNDRHGTVTGYVNHGCRCVGCRRAWTAYQHEWRHADPLRMAKHAEYQRRSGSHSGLDIAPPEPPSSGSTGDQA